MSDIIISVERIKSVEAHPQADRLEVAKILGTQCVVPKGEYSAGESVVYFPPDMVLPGDVSEKLGVQKYLKHSLIEGLKIPSRVAACRLRTVASFGFIAKLPAELSHLSGWAGTEQANVTDFYRGIKYEPPVMPRGGGGAMWGGMAPEHPMFHQYTDIQNHYRYPDAIPTGTIVRVTEKIHGCLRAQTRITMADGSKKKIIDVIAGDYVLGGWNGQVVPTRVTNTFNNGPTDRWLIVTTERRGAGRGGNAFARLRCTPNHRYWSPTLSDYIAAESLTPGDSVSVLRIDPDLTPIQKSVLLGKMLGDGSMAVLDSGAALISYGHENESLNDWTDHALGGLATRTTNATSGYGSDIHRSYTSASVWLMRAFGEFIDRSAKIGVKRVPEWVADALDPIAIAFWYMDDGSLGRGNDGSEDKANFAVCSFTEEDCETLRRGLAKFGIGSVYFTAEGYSRLRLNADDAERLFLLVAPYIPGPLQYKLPERYRGHCGWLPTTGVTYKPLLVTQKVLSIQEEICPRANRYDIETETHNYFANGVLTHNSNSRVGVVYHEGEFAFMAGSHKKNRKKEFESVASLYWKPLEIEGVLNMLNTLCDGRRNIVVFGEIYGPGVQDMDYGIPAGDIGYRVFDITDDGDYLDWDIVKAMCDNNQVELVPLLYKGPFSQKMVEELTSGPTTLVTPEGIKSKFKGREGIVITPVVEAYSEILGGRMILKSKSADYLDRKGAEDNGEAE